MPPGLQESVDMSDIEPPPTEEVTCKVHSTGAGSRAVQTAKAPASL